MPLNPKYYTEVQLKERNQYRGRVYRAANPEKVSIACSKSRVANPEGTIATIKAWYAARPGYKKSQHRKYILSQKRATPAWADQARISQIYRGCPDGFHVDHVVPLHGKTVSGLHVPENLQYLPAVDNMKKGNKFDSSSIVPSESILQSAL
jgi:hypothetical protein